MQESLSFTIPAPIGGMNARDSITSMGEYDATYMYNLFPDTTTCKPRLGYSEHEAGNGTNIETLVEYAQNDGTKQLLGARGGAIVDFTTGGASSNLGTGFTEDRWQTVQINDEIIFVNGTDQPQKYDGTTLGAASYTGITDDSVLIQASLYKTRLYFVEKDSTSLWYDEVSEITGVLAEFDVGDILRQGGKIVYAGSTTQGTGDGVQDYFTIISELGEVLVYTGDNPEASNWVLSGRYETAKVVSGNRIAFNFQNDLLFITVAGVYSVANLLSNAPVITVTDKIQKEFTSKATTRASLANWHGIVDESLNYLIINMNSTPYDQFVMNTKTGAWTLFEGYEALCFAICGGSLYFSDESGGIQLVGGFSDDGAAITSYARHSFNPLGSLALTKQITMVTPIVDFDSTITMTIGVDVDYKEEAVNGTTLTNVSEVGAITLYGKGKNVSFIISVNTTNVFEYSAMYVIFRTGGIL